MGIVHGGVYAAIAETLASMGTADGVLRLGQGAARHVEQHELPPPGRARAPCTPRRRAIHRGRTTWLWDVEMRNDDGKLCATSRVTIAVRDPLA